MELAEKLASPDFFPVQLDADKSLMGFMEISRPALRAAVFLTPGRLRDKRAIAIDVSLDELCTALLTTRARFLSPSFIFHSAFCCSTLLARYLEGIRGCFVLKEPDVLAHLAALKHKSGQKYSALFSVVMKLLSRVYEADTHLVIKPNVPCNELAFDLLRRDNTARSIYLSVPLEDLVASFLKDRHRVRRLRFWLASMIRAQTVGIELSATQIDSMSDAQSIAYWWVWNKRRAKQLMDAAPTQILQIDGNQLAAAPEGVLSQVSVFLGIPRIAADSLGASHWQTVQLKYSKNQLVSFTCSDREKELGRLKSEFRNEIAAAEAWVTAIDQILPLYHRNT